MLPLKYTESGTMMGKKLFIGIKNSQNRVPADFFWSFINMTGVPGCAASVVRAQHPWSPARHNQLFRWFLDSGGDYFVEMDIDQVYPRDYLTKMVPLIDEYKAIAPLIYDRVPKNNFFPLVFEDADIDNFTFTPMDIAGKHGIIEAPYCHANVFMAREVVEKLPFPPYSGELKPDGLEKAQHADFRFNKFIWDAGYKLYVNLDVVVEHIVEMPMNTERYKRWHGTK